MKSHGPQGRPSLADWLIVGSLLILIIGLLFGPLLIDRAKAHEAPSGWHYDWDCCGSADCMPIEMAQQVDGRYYYTTKLGTKAIVPQTKIRESKDSLTHVCIHQDILWCIYIPGGM